MTRVKDLIELLNQYPQDTVVILNKYDNGNLNLGDIEVVEQDSDCPSGYINYFDYIRLDQEKFW